ncbi:MAG: hypothetical protein WED82_12320, partial [Balneolales bacterium]
MKKIIIVTVLLVAIILLANWWSGRVISSHINVQLSEISEDRAGDISYEKIRVSPLLSQVTINNFSYRNDNNIEFTAENIRSSLTYRDFVRLLIDNPSQSFNEISYLSVYASNSSWIDYSESTEITLVDGFFTLQGNIMEVVSAAIQKRFPKTPWDLDIDLYELRDQDLNVSQSFLPGFKQQDNDYIEVLSGNFEYDPVLKEIQARNALLQAHFVDLEFDGTASYDEGWSILPGNYNINYKLNAQPFGTRFTISPELGQIAFDKVDLMASASFNTKELQASSVNLFLTEGESNFSFDQIRIHPSNQILEEYGMFSQAFGLDLQNLYLNKFSGRYILEDDRLLL